MVAFTAISCGVSPLTVEPSMKPKDTVGAGGALTTTLSVDTVDELPCADITVSFGV